MHTHAQAYRLSGIGEPTERLLEVQGYLNFAQEEKSRREAEEAAVRQRFKDEVCAAWFACVGGG